MTEKISRSISTTIIASLLGLVIWFQITHDRLSPPFSTRLMTVTRDLLPDHILPYITFGFKNMLTDIYWIRSVQDFVAWDGVDPYYLNYFRNISTLDPTFEYPYLFSILVVPQRKEITILDKVATIAQKGIEAITTSWQIPFYLGTQYYLFTSSYQPTEKYLEIAASRKGAPDGVYLTYSSFVAKDVAPPIKSEADYRFAQSLIDVIYNNTDNETIKEIAAKGFQENMINQMLQKGIAAYKTKYKKYPTNLEAMLKVNLISLPQDFFDHFIVTINERDGSYKVMTR